jgi:hypothetical protein
MYFNTNSSWQDTCQQNIDRKDRKDHKDRTDRTADPPYTTTTTRTYTTYQSRLPADDTNFAKMFGMVPAEISKTPMPAPVRGVLQAFLDSSDASKLSHTTFRYIHSYMTTGAKAGRLSLACEDFGYTIAELQTAVAEKRTSVDIAKEIMGR